MAFSYSPKIVTDGLVFAVDAANKKSYPGSGTTWTDLAGNNNGTLTNGPTFDSGNGGSIVFDGSDDYVGTNFNVDFTTADFTLDAWVYPTFDSTQYGRPIITMNGNGGCSTYDFALEYGRSGQSATNKFGLITGGGPGTPNLHSNTHNKENWYHVMVTREQNNASSYTYAMYVNSTQENTITGNYYGGDGGILTIGKFLDCGAVNEWLGNIAQIKIYTRALSPTEITQNYNALKSRFGL